MEKLLVAFCLIFATQSHADVIKLSCKYENNSEQRSILLDLKNKKVKDFFPEWSETIFWGEKYIIYRVPDYQLAPNDQFFQFGVNILNRENMIMLSTNILANDFMKVEFLGGNTFDGTPNVQKCRQGF